MCLISFEFKCLWDIICHKLWCFSLSDIYNNPVEMKMYYRPQRSTNTCLLNVFWDVMSMKYFIKAGGFAVKFSFTHHIKHDIFHLLWTHKLHDFKPHDTKGIVYKKICHHIFTLMWLKTTCMWLFSGNIPLKYNKTRTYHSLLHALNVTVLID